MTNETDLRECSAQIELIRQLITQPETFELDKVLIELETKKKLLMTFKPRSYHDILKSLESGELKYPGDWEPEEVKKEPEPTEEELAEIERLRKIDKLKAELVTLETEEVEE